MDIDIRNFITDLQQQEVLPQGEFTFDFREQPASYIWQITLGDGYFVKQIKVRQGSGDVIASELACLYQREYDALQKLATSFSALDEFSIPEVVYGDPDKLLLVTKALSGELLQELCNRYAQRKGGGNNGALDACYDVGRFLNVLHQTIKEEYRSENLEQLLDYIRERLSGVNFSSTELAHIETFLLTREKEIKQNLQHYFACYVHHDLNPTNILVDSERISVLDFADTVSESPYQDLVYFPLMIKGQLGNFLKYRPAAARELVDRFYKGYGCQLSTLEDDPLYRLYVLKNLVIFMKTYVQQKEQPLSMGLSQIKNRLVLEADFRNTRRAILTMTR